MTVSTLDIPNEDRVWFRANTTQNAPQPRLVVLYHASPDRIGAATVPGDLERGEPVQVGRLSPHFARPWVQHEHPSALNDPYMSRHQVTVRWIADLGCFEVHPNPSASRPMHIVDLAWDRSNVQLHPLNTVQMAPPGTLITIGKRALILLDCAPYHGAEQDRLGMIGETQSIWDLRLAIQDASRFQRPVLVLGQTGAGKELVARAIHSCSERANGPFIPVNCAALPEQLVESLLFGHVKGAFTGATTDSKGMFHQAQNGTLFLDELGELPMSLQAKLLRVLQENEYTPVGGRKPIATNARIVAATHHNPMQDIQDKLLRSDLYYRLAAHTIRVPSLRDRCWDIPLLTAYFLQKTRATIPEIGWMWPASIPAHIPIPMEFIFALLRHGWPGNIRELQNVIEQCACSNLRPGPFRAPALETLDLPAPTPSPTPLHGRRTLDPNPPLQASAPMASSPSTPNYPSAASAPNIPARAASPDLDLLVRQAAQRLSTKAKTLQTLLALPSVRPLTAEESVSPEYASEAICERLFELLHANGFNQAHVADQLGVARSTLIRLMARCGLPRPQDLTREQLQDAHDQHQGLLEPMARTLRVSSAGLKMRLTREGIPYKDR